MTNWGEPGVPLLPKPLRDLWASERLPDWIAVECHLPLGTSLAALDESVWQDLPAFSPRIERYVLALLDTRYDTIRALPALGLAWPIGLNPDSVDWRSRTRNCLIRAGALVDRDRLARLTYGDLYAIPRMGAVSVVDFATTGEAAITHFAAASEQEERELEDLIASVSREPWVETITPDDPRFADYYLGALWSTSQDRDGMQADSDIHGLDVASVNDTLAQLGLHSRDSLRALLVRVREIQHMPLDVALRDYTETLCYARSARTHDPMRISMLLARFGLNGGISASTLQECADGLGITRERFRQIQEATLKRKPAHQVYIPALDRALETLAHHAPMDTTEAAQLLVHQGITTTPFRPESVLAAAEFCGRPPTFTVEPGRHGARVVTDSSLEFSSRVVSLAARLASASGMSNVATLVAAANSVGVDVGPDQVRQVLQHQSTAEFLDETNDWYWMPDGNPARNRLMNTARRMLAVASPLDIRTIREGVQRLYRNRSSRRTGADGVQQLLVPPRKILAAFFSQNAAFVLESDAVRSSEPLDYRAELGETERIMLEVLRSTRAGILDRHRFADACTERGMNLSTFSAYLGFSPIIEHIDTNIWGLRGVHVDPVEVERLREELAMRPREHRLVDFGWTDTGNLWLAMRLVNLYVPSYTQGIPVAILPYVAGRRFQAVTREGLQVGEVVVDERGASWGYSSYLAREGADEDDILYTEFDLTREIAMLELESEDFLEPSGGPAN